VPEIAPGVDGRAPRGLQRLVRGVEEERLLHAVLILAERPGTVKYVTLLQDTGNRLTSHRSAAGVVGPVVGPAFSPAAIVGPTVVGPDFSPAAPCAVLHPDPVMLVMRVHAILCVASLQALSACASTGSIPRPFPTSGERSRETPRVGPVGTLPGDAIAGTALRFQGFPYRMGGADPAGFDCSGLVRYVFAQYGILVPRLVAEQYEVGRRVKPTAIRPGDLVFFATKGPGATHVGLAVGKDQFVHAPTSNGVVRVATPASTYLESRYVGARRLTTDN
jgi:cell wall-associated NlpC family hydrolase